MTDPQQPDPGPLSSPESPTAEPTPHFELPERPEWPNPAAEVAETPSEPAEPAPKATERPHPLTPLVRGWILFVGVLIWIGREFIPDGSGQVDLPPWQFIVGSVGVLVILMFLVSLAGWWFTRFVIDDEEFRLETGALFRSSKVVPFERIQTVDITQPLLARVLGLAELKIDAGSDSLTLRFLSRGKAYRFRDFLIARATGRQVQVADQEGLPTSGLLADVGAADEVLIRLNPRWVVIAFFASAEFVMSLLALLAAIVMVLVLDWWWVVFPLLIPSAIGLATMASRKVLNQWNYTLSRSPSSRRSDNLRVARGLTNLSSQTVPTDRIQGIRLRQSFLWRYWDLWQIDVDILGQAGSVDSQEIGSLLLPPAPPSDVAVALNAIWPGFAVDSVELHGVPQQVRWLRPVTAAKMRWGWNADVMLARTGRFSRTIMVVPHVKAQSLRIEQGPLQRKLGVASVAVHTTPGPVMLRADHLAVADARELTLGELARARQARQLQRLPQQHESHPGRPTPEAGQD